jgi:hypothetical protein
MRETSFQCRRKKLAKEGDLICEKLGVLQREKTGVGPEEPDPTILAEAERQIKDLNEWILKRSSVPKA